MTLPARLLAAVLGLAMLTVGCAPPLQTSVQPQQGVQEKPASKKVITMADSYEPKAITETFVVGKQTTNNNIKAIVNDNLLKTLQFQVYEPQLALELPSIEKGTWKVNGDGTMETTWKLRPNVKWHDGEPFTSADLLFTFQASRDTEIAGVAVSAADRQMASASAPDPLTFVVHWSAPFVAASITPSADILPKHLIEPLYARDKQSLTSTALFSTEFVGLGPYRMTRWEQGSFVETTRFNDYYLGRPPLDSIVVRFVSDPNALIASILAESVDTVLSAANSGGVSIDQAVEVKRRWEGTGNQVLTSQTGSVASANPQYQPQYARPADTMSNLTVRKALLHAINRPGLTEVLTAGLSPVADSYYHPSDPLYAEMQPSIARFPYDPTRAQQLLVEAGWNKGADGVSTRASDGQRLELDFWIRGGAGEKAAAIIADDWNRIGVAATPYVIPPARRTDREYEVTRPGFLCCISVPVQNVENGNQLTARSINSAATNWQGLNYGGYLNPKADAIVERLIATIDPRARLPLQQQLVQEYTADVALFPLWWVTFPMFLRQGIKGPRENFTQPLANIFEWDRV